MVSKVNRPNVAIVYSDTRKGSNESKHLAYYLCGQLANTGYANMHMIGLTPDGIPAQLPSSNTERIAFMPRTSRDRKVEIPASDVTFAHFDSLADCHVIIVSVNSEDTKLCKTKMLAVLDESRYKEQKRNSICIFSMQRGVKNSEIIKSAFRGHKNIVVVESAVGFAVVLHPKAKAYVPTFRTPSLVFERLTKEVEDVAIGPCNLMEYMDLEIHYRKNLTPYTWGILMWENLHAVNLLQGGTLAATLRDTNARVLWVAMIREGITTLKVASRGGTWKPALTAYSDFISPAILEMILCLPTLLCGPLCWLIGLGQDDISASMLQDYQNGRTTTNSTGLGELVDASKRYNVAAPASEAVYKLIQKMESSPGPRSVGPSVADAYAEAKAIMNARAEAAPEDAVLAEQARTFFVGKSSLKKFRGHLFRMGVYTVLIGIVFLLFIYEHEHEEELESIPGHLDQEIL